VPAAAVTGTPLPAALHVDNSRAWLLAIAPVLSLCLDAALLFAGFPEAAIVSALIAISVNIALSVWDSRYVKSLGYDVSTGLAVFLVPIYLWQRSRKIGQGQALLAAWIAVFVLALAGSAALSSNFAVMDMRTMESDLQAAVDEQASTMSTVSCPSKSVYAVHSTFLCDATDSSGQAHVQVTIENSDGSYTWRLIG
jgi:hypothetical protein